jgi:hypothetical protein
MSDVMIFRVLRTLPDIQMICTSLGGDELMRIIIYTFQHVWTQVPSFIQRQSPYFTPNLVNPHPGIFSLQNCGQAALAFK